MWSLSVAVGRFARNRARRTEVIVVNVGEIRLRQSLAVAVARPRLPPDREYRARSANVRIEFGVVTRG